MRGLPEDAGQPGALSVDYVESLITESRFGRSDLALRRIEELLPALEHSGDGELLLLGLYAKALTLRIVSAPLGDALEACNILEQAAQQRRSSVWAAIACALRARSRLDAGAVGDATGDLARAHAELAGIELDGNEGFILMDTLAVIYDRLRLYERAEEVRGRLDTSIGERTELQRAIHWSGWAFGLCIRALEPLAGGAIDPDADLLERAVGVALRVEELPEESVPSELQRGAAGVRALAAAFRGRPAEALRLLGQDAFANATDLPPLSGRILALAAMRSHALVGSLATARSIDEGAAGTPSGETDLILEVSRTRERIWLETYAGGDVVPVLQRLTELLVRLGWQGMDLVADTARQALEHQALRTESRTDALTGVGNRRALDEELRALLRFSPLPLAMVLVDIDHFKQINDQFTHVVGDEVLRRVAACISGQLRSGDRLLRYGGDEFVALLPATGDQESHRVAMRMCAAIASRPWRELADGLRVTATAGCAALWSLSERRPDADAERLFQRADEQLLGAKRRRGGPPLQAWPDLVPRAGQHATVAEPAAEPVVQRRAADRPAANLPVVEPAVVERPAPGRPPEVKAPPAEAPAPAAVTPPDPEPAARRPAPEAPNGYHAHGTPSHPTSAREPEPPAAVAPAPPRPAPEPPREPRAITAPPWREAGRPTDGFDAFEPARARRGTPEPPHGPDPLGARFPWREPPRPDRFEAFTPRTPPRREPPELPPAFETFVARTPPQREPPEPPPGFEAFTAPVHLRRAPDPPPRAIEAPVQLPSPLPTPLPSPPPAWREPEPAEEYRAPTPPQPWREVTEPIPEIEPSRPPPPWQEPMDAPVDDEPRRPPPPWQEPIGLPEDYPTFRPTPPPWVGPFSDEEYRAFRPPPPWQEPVVLPEDFRTLPPPPPPSVEPAYQTLAAPGSSHEVPDAYREFEAFTGSTPWNEPPPAARQGPDPVMPVSWYDTDEPPPGFEEFTAPNPRYDRPDDGRFESPEQSLPPSFEGSFPPSFEESFAPSFEPSYEQAFSPSFEPSYEPSPETSTGADRHTPPAKPPPWQEVREEPAGFTDGAPADGESPADDETEYQPLAWEPGPDPVADGAWSTAPNLPPGVIDLQGRSLTPQQREPG